MEEKGSLAWPHRKPSSEDPRRVTIRTSQASKTSAMFGRHSEDWRRQRATGLDEDAPLLQNLLSSEEKDNDATDAIAGPNPESGFLGFKFRLQGGWESEEGERYAGISSTADETSSWWRDRWIDHQGLVALMRNVLFVLRDCRRNLLYILLWWFFSTSIALYNRYLVGRTHGRFPAPLLMTTVRFTSSAIVATLLLRSKCCGGFPPNARVSFQDYVLKIVPMGVLTALDIGLTNLSYVLITVSFYTMCKSSTPVFLLFFAFLFRLEKPSLKLIGVILIICLGQFLTVAGESEFNRTGFLLVMASAAVSGCRWTVTQQLCQKEAFGMTNPLVTMHFVAPVVATTMAVWSGATEKWHLLPKSDYFATPLQTAATCALILLGCLLSFCIALAEFVLISHTSAVTFAVAGVAKEIVTILVSVAVMGDHLGPVNGTGLAIAIVGISLFNVIKMAQRRRRESSLPTSSVSPLPPHALGAKEGDPEKVEATDVHPDPFTQSNVYEKAQKRDGQVEEQ